MAAPTAVPATAAAAGLAVAVADDSGAGAGGFRFDADASYLQLFGSEGEWLWGGAPSPSPPPPVLPPQQQQQQQSHYSHTQQQQQQLHSQTQTNKRKRQVSRPTDAHEQVLSSSSSSGGDRSAPLAMGNYDRGAPWRSLQEQQQQQFHAMRTHTAPMHSHSTHSSHVTGMNSSNSSSAYYHAQPYELDRRQQQQLSSNAMYSNSGPSGSAASSSAYYNPADESPSLDKRPRLSSTASSSGGSSSAYERSSPVVTSAAMAESYLRPVDASMSNMYASYAPHMSSQPSPLALQSHGTAASSASAYERENPLPDFSSDWFLSSSRMSPVLGALSSHHHSSSSNSGDPTAASSSAHHQHAHSSSSSHSVPLDLGSAGPSAARSNSSGSGYAGLGLGSPTGTSPMLGVDLIPDYESSFYSLWNGPGAASLLAYDADVDQRSSQPSSTHPSMHPSSRSSSGAGTTPTSHLYLGDDELRIEYPHLGELNQGDLEYLYGPIESHTPTTPLGGPSASDYLGKAETDAAAASQSTLSDTRIEHPPVAAAASNQRKRKIQNARAPLAAPGPSKPSAVRPTTGTTSSSTPVRTHADKPLGDSSTPGATTTGGFRSLARNASIETRRPPLQLPLPLQQQEASLPYHHHQSTPHAASPSVHMRQSAATGASPHTPRHVSPARSSVSTALSPAAASATPERSDLSVSTSGGAAAKKTRSRQCDYPGCLNRARSHLKCKKHGGAHQCVFEGCTKNSQSRGLCIAHGGGSRCKVEGCVRASQSKGLCKSHGGGEFCAVDGCRKKAHLKHLCRNHGGGVRCKNPKCAKWAQRKGWCMAHAKEVLDS